MIGLHLTLMNNQASRWSEVANEETIPCFLSGIFLLYPHFENCFINLILPYYPTPEITASVHRATHVIVLEFTSLLKRNMNECHTFWNGIEKHTLYNLRKSGISDRPRVQSGRILYDYNSTKNKIRLLAISSMHILANCE